MKLNLSDLRIIQAPHEHIVQVNCDVKYCFDASLSSILPSSWSLSAIFDFYGLPLTTRSQTSVPAPGSRLPAPDLSKPFEYLENEKALASFRA